MAKNKKYIYQSIYQSCGFRMFTPIHHIGQPDALKMGMEYNLEKKFVH